MATTAQMITRIKRGLSRFNDTNIDGEILDELQASQERLEAEKTLPPFLRQYVDVIKTGAHSTIDLDTDVTGFLRLLDYLPVQVIDPDIPSTGEQYVPLRMIDYELLLSKQLGTVSGLPTYCSRVNNILTIRGRQTVDRTYRLGMYKADTVVAAGSTANLWQKKLPDLIMGDAGLVMAQSRRDKPAMDFFAGLRTRGYQKMLALDALTEFEGMDQSTGDTDDGT